MGDDLDGPTPKQTAFVIGAALVITAILWLLVFVPMMILVLLLARLALGEA